jgi:nitrogen fixation/metabolism regulation signal transduction histidine kinase
MISFLVPMTVMLLIMAAIFVFALRNGISSSVEMVYRDVNDNLANSLVGKSDPSVRDYKNAIDDVRQMLITENSTLNRNKSANAIIASLMYILLPGFFLAIIELVFLTIFFSHKIAGPVFRIELACKRVIDGDYGEEIHLRRGDKMGNLASLFNEMTKITKNRMNEALELQDETKKETFRMQNKL